MQQPKVSVIVPVYNAEKYLRKCVDSILAQTFRDFEVILVDDGSPDRSGAICDEYAQKDPRVRVIHKENGGVSSARQCGLDNARGEYTIHADPDDWVEPEMLEALYTKAKAEDADMVICDYYVNDSRSQRYIKQQPSALDHETVLRELFQQLHGSCCNKLVRRVCYKVYNVKFPLQLSLCEDLYVNASLLRNKLRIGYLPRAFYHYVQGVNSGSLVHSYSTSTYEKDLLMLASFQSLLENETCKREAEVRLCANMMKRAYFSGCFTGREFRKRFLSIRKTIVNSRCAMCREQLLVKLYYIRPYKLVRYGLSVLLSVMKNF